MNVETYLGKKGYTIKLKDFNEEQISKIKEDLTFTPRKIPGYGPEIIPSFSVFGISKKKMFLPKFYGIKTFGKPSEIKLPKEEKINLEFKGSLRENQKKPVEACLKSTKKTGGGILCLPCGYGKCLKINTPVMMYNGSIKMVQDIKIGDLLMGDDSTPRTVLSTCKGKEQMYKVIPEKGDSYTVNESHILSLKCSNNNFSNKIKKGDIIDISVRDYINLPSSCNKEESLLGYKVPVDFSEKKVNFDPYIIGLWLGSKLQDKITIKDSNIIKYLNDNFSKCKTHTQNFSIFEYTTNSLTCQNSLINELKKQKILDNKHIPIDYKCNSKKVRLKILAGIIDIDGIKNDNEYTIIQNNEKLLDDIIFISRSLGFAAYKKKYYKSYKHKGENKTEYYYKTTIYGNKLNNIPLLVKKKQIKEQKQIKNVLDSKIHLEKLKVDNYYGFEINGNRRFLLGDFTVTHNTSIACYLTASLGVKTLVVVNKEFLMDQWIERIEQFLPEARVGILRQKTIDIENKDIVIAMLHSVSMCNYDISIYNSFGLVFYDEVHCIPSKVFSKALRKINTKYHFGLSATPERADGLTKITKMYIGPIIYKINLKENEKNPKKLQVFTISFKKLPNNKYYKPLINFKKYPDVVKMTNNITKCPQRLNLVTILLKYYIINDKRHILVLSKTKQYLRDIEDKIKKDLNNIVPFKIGYYIGGMKKEDRKESETADLILATFDMAKEAMDIKLLDTLLMVTSKSNVEQSVGRILRRTVYPKERPPLVLDLVDKFSSFESQFETRTKFYKKENYPITSTLLFDETNIEQFYNDLNESTEKLKNYVPIISDIKNNVNCIKKSKEKKPNKKNMIQPKINEALYDMIDNGNFDI